MQSAAAGIVIAVVVAALGYAAFAADLSTETKPAAVDDEQYADFIGNEVFDIQDLAEGAEIQRRRFNRMTPPGFSWVQPMFPAVVPFDAENFDDKFLDELLGEDKNSVAIYPLSLALDPKTRETYVFNADGKLIAAIPADRVSREWPEDADPARVTLQLDLLPSEDVEPYLYTESRIEETLSLYKTTRTATSRATAAKGLGAGEFGICGIRKTTNGTMLITVTNGLDAAEIYAYTVAHTSSVVVATWTNEYDEVITSTNVLWHPVSPPFKGIQCAWASRATNLILTGGTGVWEDTNISSNDRVRFYAVAKRGDSDGDGLSDGAEILLHRTNPQSIDTDGDGLLDGYDIPVWIGDARYAAWSNRIVFAGSEGLRIFRGELSVGTNPLDDDTDGDGLPDGWEVQNELDPLDDDGENGPEGDPDLDGFDNALERELKAPANNGAWNGNQLAYRLMHAHEVVVTNTRSITTNLIGMRVTVEDSWDCVTGGNPDRQNNTDDLDIPVLLECGYYINIEVDGLVEDVDLNYDKVYFEAFTNNFYFMSHDGIPDGDEEYCIMVSENAEKNNLIFGSSTVKLRYNTVGYRWHSGGYGEIMFATNTGPYKVVVSGDAAAMCVGETISMSASGGAESNYTWSSSDSLLLSGATSNSTYVTGNSPGFATVFATDSNGCTGNKDIIVLKPDIGMASPLADRTLHPEAARKPLVLMQTLPSAWNGQMQLLLSGAVSFWTPTGDTPIASGIFTNSQLSQTVYLEGDGCGVGEASFSIVGPAGCETNIPLHVFGLNATLDGVAEADELAPGGFIVDRTTHTNASRTLLTLQACGPYGASGNLVLTWNSSFVQLYPSASGGSALSQYSVPYAGFNGATFYVEGVAPGSNTLAWTYSAQTNCTDEIHVTVLKVESVDVTSSESGSSANAPPFAGHTPWPFDVTLSPNPDKHMVVFYKDVIDSSFNVDDFDVTLKADVLPPSITAAQLSEVWSKISGPASGDLDRTDTFEVKYQNPKLGGVYRFDFDLGVSGCTKSEANVVLPLAGAEVDSIIQGDITRANSFSTAVRASYSWIERQSPWNGTRWFVTGGAGDYRGRPDNSSSPTVWAYNQVNTSSLFGMGAVGTWKGKPVRVAKISNFMVGYAARKIGVNSASAWISQVIGTWNDSAASKSWDAGWDIADGSSYNTTVTALVEDIWDDADDKNQKLWPNTSTANNYVVPNSFYDPDAQFTSPGFLYMSTP
ncbi:MAG: hypothetical protein PHI93_03490 [Kiritimatiellae bacterium]|jgi:hypothetical protein|nr:hypothetical protein [Kiritimatiellia bacterium]